MKITVDYEISDSVMIDHEFVAFSPASKGDLYYCLSRELVIEWPSSMTSSEPKIILREKKKWEWPTGFEFVVSLAISDKGGIYGFTSIPFLCVGMWDPGNGGEMTWLSPQLFPQLKDFPRPEKWQDSLIVNPNYVPQKP